MDQRELNYFFRNLVTFFRPKEGGASWMGECGPWKIAAWSKSDFDATGLSFTGSSNEYVTQLRSAMKGGVIVIAGSEPQGLIKILPVDGKNSPRRMIRISMSGDIREFDVSSDVNYDSGDHFIVPVDGPSDEALGRLRTDLQWLSPEQERSVYHLLSRPSIELRMQRIESEIRDIKGIARPEKIATGHTAEADPVPKRAAEGVPTKSASITALERQKGWFGRLPRWASWVGGAIIVLLLAVAIFYNKLANLWSAPGSVMSLDPSGLIEAMRGANRLEVKDLYDLQGMETVRTIPIAEVYKNPNFAIAVAKLIVLKAKMELEGADRASPQAVMKSLERLKSSKVSDGERALVAYLSCQVSDDPSFKTRVIIARELNCTPPATKKIEDIQKAWSDLVSFVKSDPEKPKTVTPFAPEIDALLLALRNAPDPFKTLYSSHSLATVADPIADPLFAEAVIKLELFRLKMISNTSADWNSSTSLTQSVAALMDPNHVKAIRAGRVILMAHVACQAWSKPELANTGVKIPGITACPDQKATELNIKAGFQDLSRFVARVN